MREEQPSELATVLLSGGIDSMVCAHLLQRQGRRVQCLFVDYGQPAASFEVRAARAVAEKLALSELQCCVGTPNYSVPDGEVLGRNAFLVFSALTLAGVRQGLLAMGIHSAGVPYYDCSRDFVDTASKLVAAYTDGQLVFFNPLIDWAKSEIVEYAKEFNLPLELTYSCERGPDPPCGQCLSCLDRRSIGC